MSLFKKKAPKTLHFAVILSDRPLDGAKVDLPEDCKMFMVTGDADARDVIPRTVLKAAAERFFTPEPQGTLIATNEKESAKK